MGDIIVANFGSEYRAPTSGRAGTGALTGLATKR
jgi:hypothetical protein